MHLVYLFFLLKLNNYDIYQLFIIIILFLAKKTFFETDLPIASYIYQSFKGGLSILSSYLFPKYLTSILLFEKIEKRTECPRFQSF